ncbi:cupredoxin family copper-binding protein [Bradyrhizobium sp.]|uniref:cupredoxin domain-containing protein n=1 Tax=Bradyrhizobium sp. TaxID=376 RepID=UPI00239457C4|nr:cupredoxin family copper-binding protein [Bradyrhizobium sp.]MDE2376580.1 cupredoxin family copper-binding protein [Bradyrhizobium sp.]
MRRLTIPGRLLPVASAIVLVWTIVPACAATIEITMENLVIAPAEVTAKVGDTVVWINKDVFAHTATAKNGDFDVNLPAKASGRFVLKKAGSVDYYCRYHPNMTAKLKIEP